MAIFCFAEFCSCVLANLCRNLVFFTVSKEAAEIGAKLISVDYAEVKSAIVSCKDAIMEHSFFETPEPVIIGDPDKALDKAKNKVIGELEIGSQTHYHMETQVIVHKFSRNTFVTNEGVSQCNCTSGCRL